MVYIRRKPSSSLEKNQASEIVEDPSFLSLQLLHRADKTATALY